MELKKNPDADLEKKRGLLFTTGIVVSLALVLVAFEWSLFEGDVGKFGDLVVSDEEEEMIPITQQEPPPPPPPPQQTPPQIEIVEDDEEIEDELEIEDTEIDDDTEIEPIVEEEEAFEEPEIFLIVEDMPEFQGGEVAMFKFLQKHLKYPQMAKDAGIQGKVFINFVVDEKGNVTQAKVIRGIGGGCDEAALAVVNKMPPWKAGKQRGKAVRVSFNLPVNFSLR